MDLEALEGAVRRHFIDESARYHLDATALEVRYALNWGDFTNAHFEISDRRSRFHLKLSRDRERLRRWARLAPLLEGRYRAPRLVASVELEGLEGLLLESSPGRLPDVLSSPALLDEVVALLGALHSDGELARALAEEGAGGDARGSVLEYYLECLEADLAESGDRFPVDAATLDWMRRETAVLRHLVEAEPAFDGAPPVPIHGDLWQGNLLVEASGRWLVLDWDGLSLGDAVRDFALLLWPLARNGRDVSRWLPGQDAAFMTRFALCARANLLDEVIDPLADWVEAEAAPRHTGEVRAAKLSIHRRALADYRARYSPNPIDDVY